MKTSTITGSLGVLALLCSSVGTAASLTVAPSTLNPPVGGVYSVGIGEVFTVALNAADIVNIGGITLSMVWDATKVAYTSSSLPATGPVAIGTGTFLVVTGPNGNRILDILPGAPPVAGNFPVAVITFQALAAGPMNLVFSDDGGTFSGWFDNDTAESVAVSYTNANITVVPAPAALWLLGTGVAGLVVRSARRRAVA